MIVLNTKKFTASLTKLEKENVEAVKSALYKVGVAIVNKAEPMVPILEGNLVGSVAVSVGTDVKYTEGKAENKIPVSGAMPTELRVSYNMPYVYRLHEFPFNPGPKSRQKGLTAPGYKWLNRAISQLDIPALMKKFYNQALKKVIT